MIERRRLLTGLASLIAAPAIVRVASLMPVKPLAPEPEFWLHSINDGSRWYVTKIYTTDSFSISGGAEIIARGHGLSVGDEIALKF